MLRKIYESEELKYFLKSYGFALMIGLGAAQAAWWTKKSVENRESLTALREIKRAGDTVTPLFNRILRDGD